MEDYICLTSSKIKYFKKKIFLKINLSFVCENRTRGMQQQMQQVQQRVQGAVAQAATQAAVNELSHAFANRFK